MWTLSLGETPILDSRRARVATLDHMDTHTHIEQLPATIRAYLDAQEAATPTPPCPC